jgi:hypothetical protein
MGRPKKQEIDKVKQIPISVPGRLVDNMDRKELIQKVKEYTVKLLLTKQTN